MTLPNVSADLIWEIVRKSAALWLLLLRTQSLTLFRLGNNNAYLVKRKGAGGVQFSRDPMNLTNTHSRKVPTAFPRGWSAVCPAIVERALLTLPGSMLDLSTTRYVRSESL